MAALHTEFSTQAINDNNVSASDKRTFSYISQYGDIIYDAVIAQEPDWQVFHNLSGLRQGIFSWYDFSPGASVLEVGAGFGALTGLLCRRCACVTATDRSFFRAQAVARRYEHRENLQVYAGDAQTIEFPESFDYIIVIGLLERAGGGSSEAEPYAAYLRSLQRWLKPGGCFFIAVENRFGLRYFCGEPEPHTGMAFDGINRYPRGTSGRSFSRREIADVVRAAGFGYHRFYYPLPDYKLPQLIYTDEYLPEKNLKERLIPYYRNSSSLVASERELYDDIVANSVFPFFANSFLVECRMEEFKTCDKIASDILYAAVSSDRGEARSYATVIHGNGIVRKTPLHEEGRSNARKLYRNLQDLQNHGIPVVEHRLLKGDVLEMPYISWPTLSNYIKEIMGQDQEEFLRLIDRIYAYILQSSEQVPEGENALPAALGLRDEIPGSRMAQPGEGMGTSRERESGGDRESVYTPRFGPILKKAYMELIPLNCFYHADTGDFLYFDQEFVRENYPARYVLFRAIHYIYCFTPNAERYYPRKELLRKYDMEDTWDIYLREETRFLDEVRNHKMYRQFYAKTKVDRGRIQENIRKLEDGSNA